MSKRTNPNSSENLDDLIEENDCDVQPVGGILANFINTKGLKPKAVKFRVTGDSGSLPKKPSYVDHRRSTRYRYKTQRIGIQANYLSSLVSSGEEVPFISECIDTRETELENGNLEITFGISPWESTLVEHKFKMLTTNDHEISYYDNSTLTENSGQPYLMLEHCCVSYRLTDEGRPGWKNLILVVPERYIDLWDIKLSEIFTYKEELDLFEELAKNSSIEFEC